jgi:hypothetical protein
LEPLRPEEEIELNATDFVLLRFFRRWPHYVVEWTRRRHGSEGSSFPIAQGEVVSTEEPDWDSLKASALDQARTASPTQPTAPPSQSAPPPEKSDGRKTGIFGMFKRKT